LKYEWPIPEPALKPLMTMDSSIESEELFGLAKELIGNPIDILNIVIRMFSHSSLDLAKSD
jgi:hypothetical protein